MRLASIDIGTNTILMLLCDVQPDGKIEVIRDDISFPRLGEGVDRAGLIDEGAARRALEILRSYKKISHDEGAVKIIACGTSAFREAANRDQLRNRIKAEVDIDVEILSGDEEAEWTFTGALSGLDDEGKRFAVIDIGGGSTELTFGRRDNIERRISTSLGVVRLTERFLQPAPPSDAQLQRATDLIRSCLNETGHFQTAGYMLVGVAGTATTVAALKLGLREFDRKKIDGLVVTLEEVRSVFETLRSRTVEEITSSIIPPGRADVILAGVLILRESMQFYHFDKIRVSTRGLRYGMVLREIRRQKGTLPS